MKDRYLIDAKNRLIIKRKGKRLPLDGSFIIEKNNALSYWLNEPAGWRKENSLPQKIKFKGNWKLNRNHDLELTLEETQQQQKDGRLLLRGEVISVDSDKLVFQMQSRDKGGQNHIQILKLSGIWQADEFNRLTFEAKKKGEPDILALSGAWQINKNQQIIYEYEKTGLKKKDRALSTLTFRGFWELNSHNRVTYILSRELNSYFDFRAQLESPDIYPKQGVIKYRIGIGLKGQKPHNSKVVSIFGAWKFSRIAGLNFEVDYGSGKVQRIEFGADVDLAKEDNIAFYLTNKISEPLGIKVIFTRRFLEKLDAQLYLKLKKLRDESGIEAGIRIPF